MKKPDKSELLRIGMITEHGFVTRRLGGFIRLTRMLRIICQFQLMLMWEIIPF